MAVVVVIVGLTVVVGVVKSGYFVLKWFSESRNEMKSAGIKKFACCDQKCRRL